MSEKIKELIDEIEESVNSSTAYIKFDNDEYYLEPSIIGNVDGLRLFAARLLKESIALENGEKINFDISTESWIHNDHSSFRIIGENIDRHEFVDKLINKESKNESGSVLGCLFFLLLVALLVMGVIYLIKLF